MGNNFQSDVNEEVTNKVKEPRKYNAVLLNDDYTPFEHVINVLYHIFGKTEKEAESIAMKVHTEGQAICGTYSKEICEMKVEKANAISKQEGFPLKVDMKAA